MYTLSNQARAALAGYFAQIAALNGVPITDIAKSFTAVPSVAQTLETKMQEGSEFLSRINMITVPEMEGERLYLGVTGLLASRTDTSGEGRRKTRSPSGLTNWKYRCEKTNFDTHILYALIDAWAKFPDFQVRVRDAIIKMQARDRMRIGFHGTSVAAETDPVANPNGEDVNKGWLHHLRTDAPAQVIGSGPAGAASKINIGAGQDYANLDALVYDMITGLDPWYQDDTDLVALVGRDLLHDKYFPMINQDQAPTEQLARDIIVSQKRLGGLPAVRVPSFPAGKILVTTYDNLSIYTQDGTRRRRVVDNAERDRVENFESVNDAYVVEDFGRAMLAENIVIGAGTADPAGSDGLIPNKGE